MQLPNKSLLLVSIFDTYNVNVFETFIWKTGKAKNSKLFHLYRNFNMDPSCKI